MTYGEWSHVLIGLDNLRHDYPLLTIRAEIYREGSSYVIGELWLDTYGPEVTEELVRSKAATD